MRMPHPTPTPDPLPFERPRAAPADAALAALPLADAAVVGFDQLLHEVHADAPRVDADRLRRLAGWLLELPAEAAQRTLDTRLRRVDELRAMLADPDWDSDEAVRARIAKLLAYVDRDDDLIVDRVPLLGLLDDVLLIELAWPAFAEEAEDYRDYCAYCQRERPAGGGAERRAAWVRDRMDELALLRHEWAVRARRYAPETTPRLLFRVS
ncbi:hypothetical protein EDC50_2211 [Vulcaniibacterium tengchongense]|uniref:DUF1232 domain-containing protein n=2 Tax=Vulcaniibacterium tengchongense TaxID=1273429 RepID=A0A3N4VBG6_9GAMM|nr:hypothetical protein EDC50_2211 [Vulcaniibacterium tengchongense]